jgi:hypothetical protein
MNIKFDVDGVIRDLYTAVTTAFNFKIDSWNWKYKGKDIYDLAREKPEIVSEAPATKYLKVINEFTNGHIELWSHQPPEWRLYTNDWLINHLKSGIDIDIRYLTPKEKYRALQKEKDAILVDDYPNFKDYNRIILIDQPYNQKTKANIRIKTEKELKDALLVFNKRI